MLNKGALSLISDYGGDSSDDDVPGPRVSTKRTFKEDTENSSLKKRFPIPDVLLRINKPMEEHIDDPSLHSGRKRTFAHERGNWASYVYIALEQQDGIKDLVKEILNCVPETINLIPVEDFHISLTKTVILKHHWITPFVDSIKLNINNINRFMILFSNMKIYCNEERTRTFIGLQIKSGYDSLIKLVYILNKCLEEFNLPKFYENPSFHMSIAWCVGDLEKELDQLIPELILKLQEGMDTYSEDNWYIYVNHLLCKIGNKSFKFNLT